MSKTVYETTGSFNPIPDYLGKPVTVDPPDSAGNVKIWIQDTLGGTVDVFDQTSRDAFKNHCEAYRI